MTSAKRDDKRDGAGRPKGPILPALPQKVIEYHEALARGKHHYAVADQLLEQIARSVKPGVPITLPSGVSYKLVDQFADGNLIYGHGGVRRFILKATH